MNHTYLNHGFARFGPVFTILSQASRRPNQAKVRSTTQRSVGGNEVGEPAGRVTISKGFSRALPRQPARQL